MPAALDTGDGDDDADVLFLAAGPRRRPRPGRRERGPRRAPGAAAGSRRRPGRRRRRDDDDDADRESVLIGRVLPGRRGGPGGRAAPVRPARCQARPPVVPPWLASRAALAATLRVGGQGGPVSRGLPRGPRAEVRGQDRAVRGARRAAHRRRGWSGGRRAEEGNWHLRQAAADRGDAAQWLALDARRQRQARWRWPVLLAGAAVLAAGAVRAGLMPGLALWRLLVAGRRWWPPRRGRAARRTSRSPTG